ncbi:MAG: serine hydrolase domain-containing protein, partial [Gemmatimonadales bacterium]
NVVQWSAGYGTADGGDDSVTVRTVFRLGELSEPVVALALHRLSNARAWNVESPVSTWAHAQTIPSGLQETSAADILSHTGPDGADFPLLQHLVEMAEGHDLEVLVRAMVLDPHHLTSMTFVPLASGGMARGHDRSGQPLPASPVDGDDISGSLFSSASDYARFLMEASTLGRRDPATWHRLVRPHGPIAEEHHLARGLGWIVARAKDGSPLAFRVGTTPGYTSFALVDETRKRALVVFTNGDGGVDLTEEVLRFLDPWSAPVVKAYLHPQE